MRLSRHLAKPLLCASLLLAPAPATAVVLHSDETRNTTAPPASIAYPAWQLQGQFLGNLGTPIAPSYFITANHIGGSASNTFKYQNSLYSIDPTFGSGGRIVLPDSDLALWKITGTFPTYATLYTNSDEAGKHLVVFGRGTTRGEPVLVSNQLKGWLWGKDDYLQSWGENDVAAITADPDFGDMLRFDFSPDSPGPNEATLTRGDSGGGVFILDNGVWKLAGINFGVDGPFSRDRFGNDPFMAALFDTNALFVADVGRWTRGSGPASAYASRISTRADLIRSLAPGTTVAQQNYTVLTDVTVGSLDVAQTTTIGNGIDPATLRAFYFRTQRLDIRDHARAVVTPASPAGTSIIEHLTIAPAGSFDLSDRDLILRSTPETRDQVLQQLLGYLNSGRLFSSSASAHTTLAISPNDNGTGQPFASQFSGFPVTVNDILVKFTYKGDANLDGLVNADDYFQIDSGFISQRQGWYHGDFNYDNVVNADDYFLIDSAFIAQAAQLGATAPRNGIVPEPATLMLLPMVALLLKRRVGTRRGR